ncbi:cobalt ECF transporter T component CbiQ [Litoribacillus peritrichatus]|uniref:Cobalt ECF transporter T component CbiQ n=1 Tax=Litoribacillus peritrichatus TaxID=718191 RepID=A0ABP7MG60_9GAMM
MTRLETKDEFIWLDRFDPRARILAAIMIALVVIFLSGITTLVAGFVAALFLVLSIGFDYQTLIKRLLAFEGFVLLLIGFLPFTVSGDSLFVVFGWTASEQGVDRAVVIFLRSNIIVLSMLSLLGTLEPEELGHGMSRLGVPQKFAHLFLMTARYLDVLLDEYQRLRLAMKARAFHARTDLHTWRSYGWLIGMLLVRSMERSQRVVKAMKCRGFQGQFYLLDDRVWRAGDSLAMGCLALVLLFLCLVEFL